MDSLYTLVPFLPLVLAVLFGISQLLLQVFVPKEQRQWLTYAALLQTAFLALTTVLAYTSQVNFNQIPAHQQLQLVKSFSFLDSTALFFYLLLIIATFVTVLSTSFYLERENLPLGECYALLLFCLSGMMLLASAEDLMTLFVGLEIMSMAVYILVGYRRNDLRSNEAAFKYFLQGALASAILLYGIALTYGVVGSVQLETIQRHYLAQPLGALGGLGLILILSGLAFKVGAVPFHNWTPDAYEGAPMPITGFMATAVKTAAFALLLKLFGESFVMLRSYWVEIVMVLAALTMITGNVLAFVQTNLKRLLAYSSVVHTGYLLMGLTALGTQSDNHVKAAMLYYLLIYVMSSLGIFMALSHLSGRGERYQQLSDLGGLAKEYPFTAVMLAVFMFSFIGVPPLGGFFAKFFLFSEVMRQQQLPMVVFAIFNSILSIAYYLRVVVVMFMQPTEAVWKHPQPRPVSVALVLSLTGAVVIWTGFAPFNLLGIVPGLTPLVDWLRIATTL